MDSSLQPASSPTTRNFKKGKLKVAAIIGIISGVVGILFSLIVIALVLAGQTTILEPLIGPDSESGNALVILLFTVGAVLCSIFAAVSILTLRATTLARTLTLAKLLLGVTLLSIISGLIIDFAVGDLPAPSIFEVLIMLLVLLWLRDMKKAGLISDAALFAAKPIYESHH